MQKLAKQNFTKEAYNYIRDDDYESSDYGLRDYALLNFYQFDNLDDFKKWLNSEINIQDYKDMILENKAYITLSNSKILFDFGLYF